jgi:N4-(beta-N-acetylglucosaminyl)-L-asparaginase
MPISRREFVRSTAAGLAAVGLGGETAGMIAGAPEEKLRGPAAGPIVIASANGVPACNRALELLKQGADPVDAVVAGVNLLEDDPKDHSVGYGGLPNEDGVVELDACVMHGPRHKGGAVAALQRIRNPSSVAKFVMWRTDHVLLVGEGALRFAKAHGFKEEDLLTDEAREIWLKWKETHSDQDDWLPLEANEESAQRLRERNIEFTYGTVTCMALTEKGDLGGCTSTSGLSYKLPGRVGDSPILGAGLYVDNEVGACGSTGRGEANLQNCSSFLVVELMRAGAKPEEACREVLRRIAARTEKRLRDAKGEPNYQLTFYAIRKDGLVGGACLRGEGRMAVHDGKECRLVTLPGLFAAPPP